MNESEAWMFAVSLKEISDEIELNRIMFVECQMAEYCYPSGLFNSLESLYPQRLAFQAFIEQTEDIRLINKVSTCSLHAFMDLALHSDSSMTLVYCTKICSAFEEIISWCTHFLEQVQFPNGEDKTDEQQPEFPVELDNNEFREILQRAIDKGYIKKESNGYKWIGTKTLCAYFSQQVSLSLELSNKRIGNEGKIGISWKPFEILFNISNLSNRMYEWIREHGGQDFYPNGADEIDDIVNP